MKAIDNTQVIDASRAGQSLFARLSFLAVLERGYRLEVLAILSVLIFYLPVLPWGGDFLYGGDVLGWYVPALAKTHSLIGALKFTAIDFSSFNGSSDFFLSPNFFAFHPIVVLYSLVTPSAVTSFRGLGVFLTLLLAFHTFVAFYFTAKLLSEVCGFSLSAGVLAGALYSFSPYMLSSMHQPPFLLCASIVPWAAYASISYGRSPTSSGLLFASLPVVFGFTGGYLPLGVASLALAAVLVGVLVGIYQAENSLESRLRTVLMAACPFLIASLVVSLYLYAVFDFHRETTGSMVTGIFYSAHQLAEIPHAVWRAFSRHFTVPGTFYEFSLSWGLIAIVIGAIFVLTPSVAKSLSVRDWRVLQAFAVLYFATVLAIFGQYSPVSDLVYYLVPQVGKMHIYQRFLLPAHLLFAVMIVIMLRALTESPPPVAVRLSIAVMGFLTLTASYITGWLPDTAKALGINNYIVFELGVAFLFTILMIFPGKTFVFASATLLISLPALDRMYDSALAHNSYEHQMKDRVALDPRLRSSFVSWVRERFPDRQVVKYADITSMWTKSGVETFPKFFPYFVLRDIRLSSYGGFTFYLSARGDYMRRMPIEGDVEMRPDWEYLKSSGADFVIARAGDLHGGALSDFLASVDKTDIFHLPNNALAVPLQGRRNASDSASPAFFDNGYVRVFPSGAAPGGVALENVALGKPTRQSSTNAGGASLAVDGNTNGDFGKGSVTHTGRDRHAWLEIDLGEIVDVESVRIWNRTDCCGFRLRDYWVFISESPFQPTATAEVLKEQKGTWGRMYFTPNPTATLNAKGARGRYIRIQFDGKQALDESFLSVAEVEVFKQRADNTAMLHPTADEAPKILSFDTDHAQWVRLELESQMPATVQYLFWDNPRISYYVDDKLVKPNKVDGLQAIEVSSGRRTVEIVYRHRPLELFWTIYGLYGLAIIVAVLARFVRRSRRVYQPTRMA